MPFRWVFCSVIVSCLGCAQELPPIPKDQGTPAQHLALARIEAKMRSDFANEGVDLARPFPIILIPRESFELPGAVGHCATVDDAPYYITLAQELFDKTPSSKDDALEEFGYQVLLHEMGHCLFHRGHDDTVMGQGNVRMAFKHLGVEMRSNYSFLPVSIMYQTSFERMNLALKKYYVRELLGRDRIQDPSDLERYGLNVRSSTD